MDRFLLCENPIKGDAKAFYILQTVKYKMLIQIIPYDNLNNVKYNLNDVFDLFTYNNPKGFNENYMLKVVEFYDLTEKEVDTHLKKILLHLTKAWKWYKAYLIWQDEKIDFEGYTDNFNQN